jgi:exopolysaccharide biosynthesis polyprenyl glycosylphosphotransferase
MLNRRRHGIRVFAYFAAELLILAGAFFAGFVVRDRTELLWGQPLEPLRSYLWLLAPTLGVWAVLLWVTNTYDGFRSRSIRMHGVRAALTSAGVVLVLFALLTILKRHDVNRSLVGVQGVVSFAALLTTRTAAAVFLLHYTQKGYDRHYVVIGGSSPEAMTLADTLESMPGRVFQVRGFVTEGPEEAAGVPAGRWTVLGRFEDIPKLATETPVDEVYLLPKEDRIDPYRALIEQCESMGITVHLRLTSFERLLSRLDLHSLAGGDYLMFSTAPRSSIQLGLKRLLDLAGSLVLLLLLSPILLLAALLVKLTSKGPVIFQQDRAGMSGRVFTLYKFRTMRQGAELERAALESKNELDGPAFKIKEDPRVTGIGKFLRKTSIDELPQLWNIVKGDMSLVGPRPLPVYEVEKFERWQRRRMSMRPGITCLWQVMGRNRVTDFTEWMKLDLEYVDRWSLPLDLKILLKTVPAVLGGRGAY